jgi:UDP-N-acetylglucosamine 2-epimerase (non-hydrolysing)/GDP/UDP-N,N'-diacetylbacillosamine 2-epimerase (hydrolysing)
MLRICAVTGSRADYGLLSVPLTKIRDDPHFSLSLIVTGQHLAPGFESSIDEIEADGLTIIRKVDMMMATDSGAALTKSAGLALIGFAEALETLQPDLLLVLGDRYEILAAVYAALLARVPVAHIAGGDVTEGAIDDAIRHAITKMSHIHFVATEQAARRVAQLGEDASTIHNVGSPGLDRIRLTQTLEREEFFRQVDIRPCPLNILVTFHPVTAQGDSEQQCQQLLRALDALGPETGIVFTGVNADHEGRLLADLIQDFVKAHSNATYVRSLGPQRYYSALRHMDVVVGNSSSGLYEAPSFGIPTVNVGPRQDGRLRAETVIDCAANQDAIRQAIEAAIHTGRRTVTNPYGDGHSAERIVDILRRLPNTQLLLKKRFVDQVTS